MRHIHWFQNDLRISDNPAIASHVAAESLLCVYLMPKARPWCNLTGIGAQRDRFLRESLGDLRRQLNALNQDLLILEGSPELVIPDLVARFDITEVSTTTTPGSYERNALNYLRQKLVCPLEIYEGNTLFQRKQLPFELEDIPPTFTPFRKKVEELKVRSPAPSVELLPPPPATAFDTIPASTVRPHPGLILRGGREAGLRRLRQFIFDEHKVTTYKLTRNCLDGLTGSSTLSPWLANGNLSAREVAHAIFKFEREEIANESTYWLYFELLWREFFHWRAILDGDKLFRIGGVAGKSRNTTFDPRAFARWCAGDTDFPIVNALMRQLIATGWMSNRGRQIAASCLVNELGLDWRFGAAFFEQQLIDYDVASNYGNWQYIAGVGCDPRGGRHFNLEKQTREHDPDEIFIRKWSGHRPKQPLHVVDAADWPIST